MSDTCCYCNRGGDLRPYGPKGQMVCYPCAMGTPQRERETERNFLAQLNAAGDIAVLDGTNVGPYPAEHSKLGQILGASIIKRTN